MTLNIPRLRAFANAATPGPWAPSLHAPHFVTGPDGKEVAKTLVDHPGGHSGSTRDHIAAMDPPTTLALLAPSAPPAPAPPAARR